MGGQAINIEDMMEAAAVAKTEDAVKENQATETKDIPVKAEEKAE